MSIDKVLLEHGHNRAISYCLWLLLRYKDKVESLDRGHVAHKTGDIYCLALYRKCVLTSDLRRIQGLFKVTVSHWGWGR